jgi:hypothetical protein
VAAAAAEVAVEVAAADEVTASDVDEASAAADVAAAAGVEVAAEVTVIVTGTAVQSVPLLASPRFPVPVLPPADTPLTAASISAAVASKTIRF